MKIKQIILAVVFAVICGVSYANKAPAGGAPDPYMHELTVLQDCTATGCDLLSFNLCKSEQYIWRLEGLKQIGSLHYACIAPPIVTRVDPVSWDRRMRQTSSWKYRVRVTGIPDLARRSCIALEHQRTSGGYSSTTLFCPLILMTSIGEQ